MRPKKVYLIDNAFVTFLSIQFSPDKGKMLENLVLCQMKRQSREVFFYNGKNECDFVLKHGQRIVMAMQVCYEFREDNKRRELKGLLEALAYFKLKEGLILTADRESTLEVEGKKIQILPVWKWLLRETKK